MKTIGMIGGTSWESTVIYYRIVNREVQRRVGGVHSAKIVMSSFDFAEIEALQAAGRWDDATHRMVTAAVTLKKAGADFLTICCNTMHLMSEAVERAAGIPLLHIADPLGEAIRGQGLSRVGLIGSAHTMEKGGIVSDRLKAKFGIETLVPDRAGRAAVHRVIVEELVCGQFTQASRAAYREIMAALVGRGAEGIVLGCTEIPLLVRPEDSTVPQFDTTTLHALAAVEWALA
jgi:amino-acid racemase